ncbi:N-acetylmuramidase domain-containing protein [Paracoccus laeviglucosivorans]|uniref:Peptidoglycan binding domain-containing protein n=1 Tax=Paracoccus laeviglucosivorans TaxID=1197861 RepID=A0A521E3S4_9RHOB|nr:N-acetylmuramidase domain-containing protein [Paracoccus laeviglucosivorans]SMO78587.1 Putative peptidoglycan binding domain-containing protein [Paracoccus laeviglucosivorans]
MYPAGFKGRAQRLTDIDVARVGRVIRLGEDEVRAVMEVETLGGGFDKQGRPKNLFEPHRFWIELGAGPKRTAAAEQGLAYPKWGARPYPAESYTRLALAMRIDTSAALRSCSWGLGQILGSNHKAAGYPTVGDMVAAFCDSEQAQLAAMIAFIEAEGLDDDLRRHDWSGFARGYNGPGYATHGYHTRLRDAYAKWQAIPDVLEPSYPKIGRGSRNAAVTVAQSRLLALGFDPRGVDGIFGSDTDAATRAFQKSVGLKDDGIIGPLTWAALIKEMDT